MNGTADALLDTGSPSLDPPLRPGDPIPWFRARSDIKPVFKISTLGGRYIVLSFLNSFSGSESARAYKAFLEGAKRFSAITTALLLVTSDPADEGVKVPRSVTGVRFFFDDDRRIARLFGVPGGRDDNFTSFIIDERLRVLAIVSSSDAVLHVAEVYALFDRLAPIPMSRPASRQAPVIIVPRVFERELAKLLVAQYETHGGKDSGFMVEKDGLTVVAFDHGHKRRSDFTIEDRKLISACHVRIQRRLIPEITRAFQFNATRIERNIVACYEAESGGHFSAHRDNTTKGTAHRRFAVSINLNSEEYEGGDLMFPEFGRDLFRPPTGGACVFSCSLLHEATPVTRGKRYVFVPFLYDDQAAAVRQENEKFLQG